MLSRKAVIRNSEVCLLLKELSNEGLIYLMAISRKNSIKKAVSAYVTKLRLVKTELNGKDLMALGYSAGPEFKAMLNGLMDARLDGLVHNREEELAYISRNYPLSSLP